MRVSRYEPQFGWYYVAMVAKPATRHYFRRIGLRWARGKCSVPLQMMGLLRMADLDDIYNTKILDLAANIARTERLVTPQGSASARSRLCGSEVSVDVNLADGRVSDYAQTVKACLLGQAAASIMGQQIVGSTPEDIRAVARSLRVMLKENGAPPSGKWADLAVLEPVRDYKHRHDAIMIVFDAVDKAISEIEAKAAP